MAKRRRRLTTPVSDGDPSVRGILGAKVPNVFGDGRRWFWTQQHGDNFTFEVLPASRGDEDDRD